MHSSAPPINKKTTSVVVDFALHKNDLKFAFVAALRMEEFGPVEYFFIDPDQGTIDWATKVGADFKIISTIEEITADEFVSIHPRTNNYTDVYKKVKNV